MSDRVHFFSWTTGVSLELPVGYESAGSDDASASYAVIGDDGEVAGGTAVQVRVVAALDDAGAQAKADAVSRLADELAARGSQLDRRDREVDGEPAVTVTVRDDAGALVHATVVAGERRLLSIVGQAPDDDGLARLDAAVDTVRLVGA